MFHHIFVVHGDIQLANAAHQGADHGKVFFHIRQGESFDPGIEEVGVLVYPETMAFQYFRNELDSADPFFDACRPAFKSKGDIVIHWLRAHVGIQNREMITEA